MKNEAEITVTFDNYRVEDAIERIEDAATRALVDKVWGSIGQRIDDAVTAQINSQVAARVASRLAEPLQTYDEFGKPKGDPQPLVERIVGHIDTMAGNKKPCHWKDGKYVDGRSSYRHDKTSELSDLERIIREAVAHAGRESLETACKNAAKDARARVEGQAKAAVAAALTDVSGWALEQALKKMTKETGT